MILTNYFLGLKCSVILSWNPLSFLQICTFDSFLLQVRFWWWASRDLRLKKNFWWSCSSREANSIPLGGLNGFCSVPEHKRVIALCSKVVTKMLRAHIEERFNEEVIIKGGHVNIRSQVKIPNPNVTIKTVTMIMAVE